MNIDACEMSVPVRRKSRRRERIERENARVARMVAWELQSILSEWEREAKASTESARKDLQSAIDILKGGE
jgi:hypothetical protein